GILQPWDGIIFILVGGLWLIYANWTEWKKAIRHILVFGVSASLPIVIWIGGRNQLNQGKMFDRSFFYLRII
ncbi:MAG: hypothetical protein N2C13_04230, partial [Chloroflexota bacterium]